VGIPIADDAKDKGDIRRNSPERRGKGSASALTFFRTSIARTGSPEMMANTFNY